MVAGKTRTEKGKPCESRGRKVTGLKGDSPHDSGTARSVAPRAVAREGSRPSGALSSPHEGDATHAAVPAAFRWAERSSMETRVFTPRFFRLLGFVVAGTLGAYVLSANLAHAARRDSSTLPSTSIERSPWGNWAKGRILVQPNADLPDDRFESDLKVHGGKSLGKINGLDVHIVQLPANANEHAVANLLAHNPDIKFAEVDEVVSPSATANDPLLSTEWQLPKINAATAWNTSTGAGITVAVLDSGVQSNHPDLQANLVPGWNVYNNNSNTNDVNGHGTAVAGVIAAIGNNGIGVVGVAYHAKVMP